LIPFAITVDLLDVATEMAGQVAVGHSRFDQIVAAVCSVCRISQHYGLVWAVIISELLFMRF